MHVLEVSAASVAEYLPVPQSVQAAMPAVALYLPATHGWHQPLLSRAKPGRQMQNLFSGP
jgi:hypothetical protein